MEERMEYLFRVSLPLRSDYYVTLPLNIQALLRKQVIHLVPRNEKLWIRKVDEHERISTFNYMSDPASDIMSKKEIDHINSFVGYHRTAPWLLSVLWLLSELAVKRFVSECNSEHQLDFKTIVQVIIQWTNKISISY
ncbi:uncharacterized protein LOC111319214 isoform X5 [Stylophora pistillata]|uniref:uncharacterized protein LOC111319214 isoform X5 n=1 Tax=Stylophora pistillata TaxID=50429 RepID=UPI000C04628C|nr:uncharacterized protein LOC111319214 isoform X5 [Stylophora pistillata]